jgi:hypothetical protein
MLIANEVLTDTNRNMNPEIKKQLSRREWPACLPVARAALTDPSADSPSDADTAHAFISISPDHVTRPKRMAVVKGEVEFIGNVLGRNGIEPNTGTKCVEIVDGAYLRRRPTLHNDFAGLPHLGPGRAWSNNQHVGKPLKFSPEHAVKSIQTR